jgi:hypothetical protein
MAAEMNGKETWFRIPMSYEFETSRGNVRAFNGYLGPFNSKAMCETQLKKHRNRYANMASNGSIDLRYFRTGPIETPTWNIA